MWLSVWVTPLIAAVLLNSADATYTGEDGFANIYGSRDVGIVAGQYDEWFFSDVDANGNPTLPKDFVANKNAQSFLHFGTDPEGQDVRAADTVYTETIDGQEAMRVIYNPYYSPLVPFQPALHSRNDLLLRTGFGCSQSSVCH